MGRQPDAADIDEIEIPRLNAVDHHDFGGQLQFALEDVAQAERDIAFDQHIKRRAPPDAGRQPPRNPLGQRADALIGRRPRPGHRQGQRLQRIAQVERRHMPLDRRGHIRRHHHFVTQIDIRMDHRHAAARQQRRVGGDEDRIAAQLHAVLGSPQHGGANAFARRQQALGKAPIVQPGQQRPAKRTAKVVEVARLAPIDIFADAACEHHPVDARNSPIGGVSSNGTKPSCAD